MAAPAFGLPEELEPDELDGLDEPDDGEGADDDDFDDDEDPFDSAVDEVEGVELDSDLPSDEVAGFSALALSERESLR